MSQSSFNRYINERGQIVSCDGQILLLINTLLKGSNLYRRYVINLIKASNY